ncbi:MAG: RNase adapter RapZ [Terriglobia bacterium]
MTAAAKKHRKHFVLITGMSGSGKGSVLKAFEDLGYHCVDNLPIDLIARFTETSQRGGSKIQLAAVVVDIREGAALGQLPALYQDLRNRHLNLSLVFLEASDKALIRRFEETRRPHPLGRELPVREGIRLERKLLKPIRQLADVTIDTTRMNVYELRELIQRQFGGLSARRALLVSVVSFGFRSGVPTDANLVFDARFLPNPNYIPRLKSKTGRDAVVQRYMDSFPQTQEFMKHLMDLLIYLLPNYVQEGKSYLTIAIGCTGGRHRSVAIAEKVGHALVGAGYKTRVSHRDIGNE